MKHLNKIIGLFLACLLCLALFPTGLKAEDQTIEIKDVQDLVDFALNCHMDSYSMNLTVELKNDLDLSDCTDFEGIPSFSGTFYGNGHTIKGIDIENIDGTIGFIRFLEKGGKVDSLNIEANIVSSDEDGIIGGIVAINSGSITNSSFNGTISAKSITGGIVGENGSDGTITNCTSSGSIVSPTMCGGIVGKNHGVVTDCDNSALINTDSTWLNDDDQTTTLIQESTASALSGNDVGGIAGYNDGTIASATNQGNVGYEHAGYNIGGIAGRNAGYILSSTNKAKVLGKQDVGGIAGQFEPYTEYSDKEELNDAIQDLHDLINTTIDDLDRMGNVANQDLDNLQSRSDDLSNTAYDMATEIKDVVNYDVKQINELSDRIDHVSSMLPVVTDNTKKAMDQAKIVNDDLNKLEDDIDVKAKMQGNYDPTQYSRLTLQSGAGGSLRSNNADPAQGNTVTITVSPDTGYVLDKLTIRSNVSSEQDVTSQVTNDKYSFEMPEENVVLTAAFSYQGKYAVSSNEGGTAAISYGQTKAKLTIVPDDGYDLKSVTIDSTSIALPSEENGTYTIETDLPSGTKKIDIEFAKKNNSYTIETVSSAGGLITSDQTTAQPNDTVTITSSENNGYKLQSLMVNGTSILGNASGEHDYTFTMPSKKAKVEAVYEYTKASDPDTEVYVTSNAGGAGVAVKNPTNNDYVLTITPSNGYELSDAGNAVILQDDSGRTVSLAKDDLTQNGTAYTYTINTNNYDLPVHASIEFSEISGTSSLTTISSVGGSVSASSSTVKQDDVVTIVSISSTGYILSSLKINGQEHISDLQDSRMDYTVPDSNDVEVVALYQPIVLAISSNESGSVSYASNGDEVLITVTPDTGYTMDQIQLLDQNGNEVLLQKKNASSFIYSYKPTSDSYTGTLNVVFKRQSDWDTVEDAKDSLSKSSDDLSSAMSSVSDANDDLQDLLTDDFGDPVDPSDLSDDELDQLEEDLVDLVDALADAGVAAGQIVSDLNTITQVLSPYLDDSYDDLMTDLDQTNDDVSLMIDYLDAASAGLDDIADYLDGLSKIEFKGTSETYDNNSKKLKTELDDISDLIEVLRKNLSENSDKIESDLRKVNDQMNEIFEIISDRLDNLENGINEKTMIVDKTTEDLSKATLISGCTNQGVVEANTNVGGIAGAIDVEGGTSDDTIELSIGSNVNAYAMVKNSTNTGFVTSKNDYVGGIAGQAALGYITGCMGKGSAESSDGSYVGGIAGKMDGMIDSCYSLAELSGSSYIGGIAGMAKNVENCYSMAYMENGSSRYGAIIGADETDEEELSSHHSSVKDHISNNYYVSDTLYGIDGISYVGVAEPITYDELLSVKGIPSDFSRLEVWFVDEDGNIIQKTSVNYGDDLSNLQYPKVATNQDNYSDWYGLSTSTVEGNIILRVGSEETVTVLSSEETFDGKALALASGQFKKSAKLNVSTSDENGPSISDSEEITVQTITFENAELKDEDEVTIRLYNPTSGTSRVYVLDGTHWSLVDSTVKGQYVQFQISGAQATIALVIRPTKKTDYVTYITTGVVMVTIGTTWFFLKKKGQSKKEVH